MQAGCNSYKQRSSFPTISIGAAASFCQRVVLMKFTRASGNSFGTLGFNPTLFILSTRVLFVDQDVWVVLTFLQLRNIRLHLLKQCWDFADGKESILTAWAKTKYIKESKTSFWKLKSPSLASWGQRGILTFRNLFHGQIQHLIRDGRPTKFWVDLWLPFERIIDYVGRIEILHLASSLTSCVSDFTHNSWDWEAIKALNIPNIEQVQTVDFFL